MALGQVDIRRGIFEGGSLSPLLFIVIMLLLTLVLRKMRAGYKLAKDMKPINHLLFMDDLKLYGTSKDQLDSLVLVELPDDQQIGEIEEEGYQYLGILQLDQTFNTKMKGKITSVYIRRVKKLCRSKLNGGNLIDGISTWAVGVVRYSVGILDWTMEEVANMDRRTRKILAMNGCLHTRSNVARLYLPRKEGRRGLIGIEECVRRESKSLLGYPSRAQSECFKLH